MKLEVRERLSLGLLLQDLSRKGDYAAIRTLKRAISMISFTEEEQKLYDMRQEGNQWHWNNEKAAKNIKDVPVDEFTTNLVRSKLAELNQEKELPEQYVGLYEKFVIAYK